MNQLPFAEVVLPLAIRKTIWYALPPHLIQQAVIGSRVEVQFGKRRRYAGVVIALHANYNGPVRLKEVLNVIEGGPIVHNNQLKLWHWISQYYMCTLGEVMQAALPSGLKLSSETQVILTGDHKPDEWTLNDAENLAVEALRNRYSMSVEELDELLTGYNSYAILNSLLHKEIVFVRETMREEIKPKKTVYVVLNEPFDEGEDEFLVALDMASKSEHQTNTLLKFYELQRHKELVSRSELIKKAGVTSSVIKALVKKEIFNLFEKDDQVVVQERGDGHEAELNEEQTQSLRAVTEFQKEGKIALVEGVTGSGKTHIYIEAVQETIHAGKQVLYLLPEIALTTQVVTRLKLIFGDNALVYHSRMGNRERVKIWKAIYEGHPLVIGARSALLLPFKDLDLVIVDEEHDASYKQHDPAPRYQARDVVIYLSRLIGTRVILGSATPSLESMWNVQRGKYGLTIMKRRFGGVEMPDIAVVDMKAAQKDKRVKSVFSHTLIEAMSQTIENGEQVLLFLNRRGYSPVIMCKTCGHHIECHNCDVTLTYHKIFNKMRCHYCAYQENVPRACPNCGNHELDYKGTGTEKIEDELKVLFPSARIARMDHDIAQSNSARQRIIERMEEGELDILVGTQMVSKGLDFEHIGLVGVINADQLFHWPDFRANERAYQMLMQVGGRAGRKKKQGKVLIQAYDSEHDVLKAILTDTKEDLYANDMQERKAFRYPPFSRLIEVTIKHKKPERARDAAQDLAKRLKHVYGQRVIGPAEPSISRIRGLYIRALLIKMEKDSTLIGRLKNDLSLFIDEVKGSKGNSSVRFNINVDP